MRHAAALLVAAAVLVPLRGLAQGAASTREYRYLMGTSVEVETYGGDEPTRRLAMDDAFGAMAEVDRLMSNYKDDSELSLVNREAAGGPVHLSDPMLAVLEAAVRVSDASRGAFDITVGPLVRLWGFHDRKPHMPTASELAVVRPLVDYRNLLIDRRQHTVRFTRPGVELDLGGIAKGFAVEVAANAVRKYGLAAFIDAGGNQYLLGTAPGRRSWSVGIRNPDVPDQLLGVVECGEGSVSTSADYATFVTIEGRKYGHILDPRTLNPADGSLSVTIVARDGTLADAMSKAAFILGPSAGLAFVDAFPGAGGIIAFRRQDGTIGTAVSERLKAAFHPSAK